MRGALIAILGCSFGCSFDSRGGTGIDARPGGDADAAPFDATASSGDADPADSAPGGPFCDDTDLDLIACYRFEDNANDESMNQNHGNEVSLSYTDGFDGRAVVGGAGSEVEIAEDSSLDVDNLTMEMWIRPAQFPTGTGRAGLLDNESQYSIFLYADGLECFPVSTDVNDPFIILRVALPPLNQWTHVACTYDGGTLRIYYNGVEVGNRPGTGPVRDVGTAGISLLSNNPSGNDYIGVVDNLRLWRTARTPAQVCEAAGGPPCN